MADRYDDGGFSGKDLERPAAKRLMQDIERGLIDIVVVYKIDRLSRSMADFVDLMKLFDKHNVTFVSVTQHFNTDSAMGKLILNILQSFAQFEREMTAERIRDKFAASKKKGMWMGGCPPLGYDVFERKLEINPAEAGIVQFIFERFLETKSTTALVRELEAKGYTQTCEQLMIAQEAQNLLKQYAQTQKQTRHIPVAVSARHVHLSQEHVELLFGKGYSLKKMRTLSQPEGWAAEETVEVIGPKGSFDTVRVLGPTRKATQIEVSKTDTFTLGIEVPVRPSGKLEHTPFVKLRGPVGQIETNGLIIAARHIHMSPEDGRKMDLNDGDYVDVRLDGERGISFANTLVRIKEGYITEMHIDTDEANAAGIAFRTKGELVIDEPCGKADIVSRKNMVLNERKSA